jgi:pilus assembly protein CpaC
MTRLFSFNWVKGIAPMRMWPWVVCVVLLTQTGHWGVGKTVDTLEGLPTLHVGVSRSELLTFKTGITRVSVADPNILDVIPLDPDQFILNGKARGTTTVLLWDKNNQVGEMLVQVHAHNEELSELVKNLAQKNAINTLVTDDSVVFSGQADSSSQMDKLMKAARAFGYKDENIIDLTDAHPMQVSLKVKITESSREVVKTIQNSVGYNTNSFSVTKLGSNIDTQRLLASLGQAIGAAAGGAEGGGNNVTNGIVPNLLGARRAALPYALSSQTVGGVTSAYLPNWNRNLQFAFDYLETNGKLKTLAEPTLVVSHGQEGSFLAGGEVPFVSGTDRNGGPILSFKEYGVKLRFKPVVNSDATTMRMEIEPEVSTLDRANCVQSNGAPVCGILKRSSKTVVELKNNDTLFISGIISDEEQEFLQKIPYMGDLPIIGSLFRNKNARKTQRELLIVVTPTILKQATQ